MIANLSNNRSSIWYRLQKNPDQIFHFVARFSFDCILKLVISLHLILMHFVFVVSVKWVYLIDHDEEHHTKTPDISREGIIRNLFEHFWWVVRGSAAVGVAFDHTTFVVGRYKATEAKVGKNWIKMTI